MSTDSGVYDSLVAGDVFRLIKLKAPSTENGYRLETFALDDLPPFFALSYCWGSPRRSDSIVCNSKPLAVSLHLKLGLAELCSVPSLDGCWFWIDQICVNQNDLAERSQQVQLMKEIYSNALTTVVWLGPSQGPCDEAFHLADKMVAVCENPEYSALVPAVCSARLPKEGVFMTEDALVDAGLPPFEDPAWTELERVVARPWFARQWVLQEVILSRTRPILVYDGGLRNWDSLLFALVFLCQMHGAHISRFETSHVACGLVMFLLRNKTADWDLASLIIGTRNFGVTEPRDSVFALLSLALETATTDASAWPLPLRPNYEKPWQAIYTELTEHIISASRSLKILCLASNRPGAHDGLPSWVPVFHRTAVQFGHLFDRGHQVFAGQQGKRYASRSQRALLWKDAAADLSGTGRLRLQGLQVATVRWSSTSRAGGQRLFAWADEGARQLVVPLDAASVAAYLDELLLACGFGVTVSSDISVGSAQFYAYEARHRDEDTAMPYLAPFLAELTTERENPDLRGVAGIHHIVSVLPHDPDIQLYTTEDGRLGIASRWMQPGDVVAVLFGGSVPFLLRPDGDEYLLLGECYLSGVMTGQAVVEWREGKREATWFTLK